MKYDKEDLELYESIKKKLIEFHKEHSPCQFIKGECIAIQLNKKAKTCCYGESEDPCALLGENGCTTTNIACMTFLCKQAVLKLSQKAYNEYQDLQKYYEQIADRKCFNNPHPYMLEEEQVKEILLKKYRPITVIGG